MSYSAFINGLKVLLPVLALGLLATLFLIGRNDPIESTLPYLNDLRTRVANKEGMNASVYTSSTDAGDAVRIVSDTLQTDPTDPDRTLATNVHATIDYTDGSQVVVTSEDGAYSDNRETLVLTGHVKLRNSDGYELRSEELITEINLGRAESPGPVEADGPIGRINAGGMVMTRPNKGSDDVHLVFTNGVKLVYHKETNTE